MAFTEFYCQSGGSNLNAGSTTANAASLTYASGTWVNATGVFAVAAGNPVVDGVLVGDWASVYPDAATVGVFVGLVTARDATTITVSLTNKSGTSPADGAVNTTLKIGGAWLGPNGTSDFPFGFVQSTMTDTSVNQPRVNLKNTANYAITAAVAHANNGPMWFQGYTTTPGDGGRAVIDGTIVGASYIMLTLSGNDVILADMTFQNNGTTGNATGITVTGTRDGLLRITVTSVRGHGLVLEGNSNMIVECVATGINTSAGAGLAGFLLNASNTYNFFRCVAYNNMSGTTFGFRVSSGASIVTRFIKCIIANNSNTGIFIDSSQVSLSFFENCDFAGNTGSGLLYDSGTGPNSTFVENCNFVSNGGFGINRSDTATTYAVFFNNGFFGNTSGEVGDFLTNLLEEGRITYTATPYRNSAGGDYAIHNVEATGTANGGYGTFLTTLGYPDMGSAQHRPVPPFII